MPDIRIENHGSVALWRPLSDLGQKWTDEHIPAESWQFLGKAIAIEPRYAGPIVVGARDDGLSVEEA